MRERPPPPEQQSGAPLPHAHNWFFNQPHLLLSLASLFWAGNIVIGRFVAGHVPPLALAWIRWVVAFFIVLPIALPHLKRDWDVIRNHLFLMTVLSLAGVSIYNALAYWALQHTIAINALLMLSTGPLLVAAWSLLLFGEKLTAMQAVGIILSLAGVVVIVSQGRLGVLTAVAINPGDLWFFIAVIVFAFYSALAKKRPPISSLSFLAFTMGWGALWLTPAFLWENASGSTLRLDAITIGALAYVIVFASLLGYFFFNRGIELIGPNRAAPYLHLIPVFGAVLAILFLGERPQLFHAAGFALVVAGIALATRRQR